MPRKRKRSWKQSSWLCSLQESRVSNELRTQWERTDQARREIQSADHTVHVNTGECEEANNPIDQLPSTDRNGSRDTDSVCREERLYGTNAELQGKSEEGACPVYNGREDTVVPESKDLSDANRSGVEFLNPYDEVNEEPEITPFNDYEVNDPDPELLPGALSNDLDASQSSLTANLIVSNEPRGAEANEGRTHEYNESYVNSEIRRWENPYELLSLVMVTGSVRFPVHQYEVVRCLPLSGFESSEEGELSSYNAVRRLHQRLQRTVYPKSETVEFEVDEHLVRNSELSTEVVEDGGSEEGVAVERGESERGKAPVRIVLPTSWARHDVATPATFRFLYESERSSTSQERTIENSDIVQKRHKVTCPGRYLFVDCDDDPEQVAAGSIVRVTVTGTEPSQTHPYRTVQDSRYSKYDESSRQYLIEAEIAETWYVGSSKDVSASGKAALSNPELSEQELVIVKCLAQRSTQNPTSSQDSSIPLVLPGDQCVLLRGTTYNGAEGLYAILVHRFWKDRDGIPSEALLWVKLQDNESSTKVVVKRRQVVVCTEAVRETPALRPRSSQEANICTNNQGTLEDGTPYVVYRILLYCDDFKPSSSLYPRGSAGGCYMLPIGLPPEARRTTSSVRVISLTPPGVSTNKVLHYIIDDLVDGVVNGVDGIKPDGTPVKIFLDVLGFIGGYPASAHAVDVMGHIARTPCTHCTFRKLDKRALGRAKNGYSTKIHSRNSTSLRCGERHKALRESDISDRDANRLGMKPSMRLTDSTATLFHLQEALSMRRNEIPLNDRRELVVSGLFDAHRCNVVALDHLLSGLAINVMDCLFKEMPNDHCLRTDSYIVSSLRENGLLKQNQVYNPRTQKMNSMSLSGVFCVFAVSSQILDIVFSNIYYDEDDDSLLKLLITAGKNLQRLITYTYWLPTKGLDGDEAVQLVRGSGRQTYFQELQKMAAEYVSEVDDICSKYPESSTVLDKPNLHRLLELYYHSVPAYGHCREFSELVFEHAHQPLKRYISQSNHRKSQIFAVDHCVANDWQGLLACMHNELSSGDARIQSLGRRGLRRFILGPCSAYADANGKEEITRRADETIAKLFNRGLLRMFKQNSLVSHFASPVYTTWRASRKVSKPVLSGCLNGEETSEEILEHAVKQQLRMHHPVFGTDGVTNMEIEFHAEARRTRVHSYSENSVTPLGGHEVLKSGCAIQARVDRESLRNGRSILPSDNESPVAIFAILAVALARRSGEGPWVLVSKCKIFNDRVLSIKEPLGKKTVQCLRLSQAVRRIGLYHDCRYTEDVGRKCAADLDKRTVEHSGTLLSGARMRYQTRR